LFTGVCEAVQHAHQKGLIHRDLKPGNILVGLSEGAPRAKVIDFGIAKATGPRLTEKTLFTAQGMLVGTPAYMSPEQAEMSGIDVDTRSDVYSLGILLYELLSGEPPFHPRRLLKAGYGEIQRIIREEEPQRPSTKSTTIEEGGKIARARQLNVTTLRKRLDGDLDWIAMKSLEKDRTRRYATVQELSSDLGRHLANEPVSAGPPSVRYRCAKFVRRNRVGVAAAAMVLLALGAGIVSTTWQWQEARRAEQVAVTEREKVNIEKERLENTLEFQEDTLTGLDAKQMGLTLMQLFRKSIAELLARTRMTPEEIEATIEQFSALAIRANPTGVTTDLIDKEILGPAVATIDKDIIRDPLTEARLRNAVATTYVDLGLHNKAQPLLERALALRREHLGNEHPDTLSSINQMGLCLSSMGRHEEAASFVREALEARRLTLGNEDPHTLQSISNMGVLLMSQGKHKEAEPYLRTSLEGNRRVLGNEHPATLESISTMASFLVNQGKKEEAEPYLRKAMEGNRRVLGDGHPSTLEAINDLGAVLAAQEKYEEAKPYLREALEGRRRVLSNEHHETLVSIESMARILRLQEKFDEAETYTREAMEWHRRLLGDEHGNTLGSIEQMAYLMNVQGRLNEAEPYLREVLEGRRRVLGNEDPDTQRAIRVMGRLLYDQEKHEEAEPYFREALERSRRSLGDEHHDTLMLINSMGMVLFKQGKYEEAEALVSGALKLEPEDKEHQERFNTLLDAIEEARKKKTAEDPSPEKEGKPAKTP
ncbi:MAG: hypothetical protein CMO35_10535, partial [Verrucomicrobiaceae bacterium]|nr:hypothetical protein [Verrucomicrobiaceae bacterium]